MVVEEEIEIKEKNEISGSKMCPVCRGIILKGSEAYVSKLSFESKQRGYDSRCRYYDERCLRRKLREDLREIYIKMMKSGKYSGFSYPDIDKALDKYEQGELNRHMNEWYVKIIV